MKQRFWKQLKAQICPKQKWVKDKQQSKCLCCSKQFHPLIRRKHHCRFCGNIFCDSCSNFFINGNYIGMPKQKYVRHCQFCYHKIDKFIRDCSKLPDHDLQGKTFGDGFNNGLYENQNKKMNDNYSQNSSNFSSQQLSNINLLNINNQQKKRQKQRKYSKQSQGQNQRQNQDLYYEQQQQDIENQNFHLNKIFAEIDQNDKNTQTQLEKKLDQQLKNIIKNGAQNLLLKFNLDGKFWTAKLSQLAYKGALQTKMQTLGQANNQNAMDIAKVVRFKTIISPQNQITSVLMKGIVIQKNLPTKNMIKHLSKPRILIVQKSIDTDSLTSIFKFEQLVKNQKVIMKKILQKIVKLQPDIIFVQNSVSMFALDYFQERKIAVVSKFKQKDLQAIKYVAKIKKPIQQLWMIDKYKPHNILGQCDKIYFKEVRQGQSLMFMQGEVGMRTIILGQSNQQTVSSLKKCLQILLRFAKMLILSKYVIMNDICMQRAISKYKSKINFLTFFTPDIHQNVQTLLMKQEVCYTEIIFGNLKVSDAPKNYQQYASRQGKYLIKEICGKIQFQKRKIYSSNDITLGSKILLYVANAQKVCKKCQMVHSQSFYFNQAGINHNHPLCISIQVQKRQNNQLIKKPFIQDIEQQQTLTLQNLKFFLKKQKQLLTLESYIICSVCRIKLSGDFLKLGKNYLENSFNKFISDLADFHFYNQEIKSPEVHHRVSFRKMNSQCLHETATRIIEYSGTMIKFNIQNAKFWQIDQINLKSPQSIAQVATFDQNFIRNLYNHQLNQKKELMQQILTAFTIYSCTSIQNNSKIITHQTNLLKTKDAFQKLKQNYQQVKQKSQKYLENIGHDWTLFMRQIYKMQSVLKPMIQILQYLDSQIGIKQRNQQTIILRQIEKQKQRQRERQKQKQIQNQNEGIVDDIKSVSSRSNAMTLTANLQVVLKDVQNIKKIQILRSNLITNFIKRNQKCRFPRSQGSYLYFNPIYTNDPVSVIASGLNSMQFKNIFTKQESQLQTKDSLTLKLVYNKKLKTNWQVKTDIDLIHGQIFNNDNQKEKVEVVQLTVYYHKQFEQLRKRQGIQFDLFVRSMCGCRSWDSSGGKSNSKFAKSHNQLLVVKIINQKQFVQFQKFTKSYLKHIQQSKIIKQESLIARIYGIYQVSIKGKQYKCIVMQNIFFGLSGNLKVYDLKGSQVNRLNMPNNQQQKNITGQDTNFKIDRDCQPLIIPSAQYDKIIRILQVDATFLKDQAVIDYSLLVILSGNKSIRMGIIDFMRPYQFIQKFETQYKKLRADKDPTVIPPDQYAQRFFLAMKKYFIKIQ